jgi:hypothetical protein
MSRDSYDLFSDRDRGRFGYNETSEIANKTKVSGTSDLIDLDMALHAETHPGNSEKGAVLVSNDGDEEKAVWIPKSLCQFERSNSLITGTRKNGQKIQLNVAKVTTQQWVARDKGLL